MSVLFRSALVVLVAASMLGCSSARIVHDTRTGGTVALRGPRDGAREKAETLMLGKCPSGYDIVEQGEVVYGQSTHSYGNVVHHRSQPITSVQTRSYTTNQTEWQLVFQCKGAHANAKPYVVRF